MESSKRINLNDAPTAFKIYLLLISAAGFFLLSYNLDNDFYFLYPTGEYIVKNGFPTHDFLSMHSSMSIIVQQWLTDVIFYYIYSALGKAGMIAFVCVCYAIFCILFFKLVMLITENFTISAMCAFFTNILLAIMYMRTRPQIITFILIAAELYVLEKYVKTQNAKHLIALPFISLLLINFHSSMWLMLFVFALPYVAQSIPVKFKKVKQEPCCSFSKLLICGIICFAIGFLNPYTYKSMIYVVTSFGISEINNNIQEMAPATFESATGKLFFAIVAIMLTIIIVTKKKNYQTRFVLLFLCTLLLALMNFKSFSYFIIGGTAAFSYYCKDFQFHYTVTEKKRTKKEKGKIVILIALIVALLLGLVVYETSPLANNANNKDSDSKQTYEDLDKIVDILDKSDEEVILYAGFNNGQYMEFKGYHPFIDGRAELFFKTNNKEYDYFIEYNDVRHGRKHYKDFLNKYKFNYIVVSDSDGALNTYIAHDNDYQNLYNSKNVKLYKHK